MEENFKLNDVFTQYYIKKGLNNIIKSVWSLCDSKSGKNTKSGKKGTNNDSSDIPRSDAVTIKAGGSTRRNRTKVQDNHNKTFNKNFGYLKFK